MKLGSFSSNHPISDTRKNPKTPIPKNHNRNSWWFLRVELTISNPESNKPKKHKNFNTTTNNNKQRQFKNKNYTNMTTTINSVIDDVYCSFIYQPRKIDTNRLAIDLNNRAISSLQCGNVVRAFEMLSKASKAALDTSGNHQHGGNGSSDFSFHWEDCSMAFSGHSLSEDESSSYNTTLWQGTVPFLFLRGLRVSIPPYADIDSLCSCSFAWVISYNLGLCCSLLGTRLGDRGYNILRLAFELYSKVQERIDMEPNSVHWNILQMSILNNQACVYYDFSMPEGASECLRRLVRILKSTKDMRKSDRKRFILNVQILGGQTTAPAA